MKVLLIIEQCNPKWASVPLEGYNFYREISKLVDVTLVTHERNEEALKRAAPNRKIVYMRESSLSKIYYRWVDNLTTKGRINWPLLNALSYPIYAEFNHNVYKKFKTQILRGDYDIVHVITPMIPRYPVKVVKVCGNTPFLLGPVNGGIPFPTGFQEVAKQEFAYFNFLRAIGRTLIPGYVETYKKADRILAGSTYTLNLLKELFAIPDRKISLFYENGISKDFFSQIKNIQDNEYTNLLFVGRLVPYKGADMLLEAIGKLDPKTRDKTRLTIVGDGSEKNFLEKQSKELNLDNLVTFTGWVKQQETLNYYRKSDIFCFPSIREFGGAVVLEAMACGLPCIVINNGGIGEYITEKTGFRIDPISRDYVIKELTKKIKILVENKKMRDEISANCLERVRDFEWESKARKIVEIYSELKEIKNKELS